MGLRVAKWPKATAQFDHNEPFWTVDPSLTAKDFPHKEESGNFRVSTNNDGLRSVQTTPEKQPGEWRIAAMGCSTTFGWGVGDEQSYPARLEQYIHKKGISNTTVINGGQPGYTSFQGLWLWDSVLKNYYPDVVLIGFVVQDARKAAYTDKSQAILQRDYRFMKNNIFYQSRIYLGLRALLGSVQIRAKERGEGDEGGVYRVPPQDYVDNIRSLVANIQKSGGTPILFGYPLEREGYTSKHRRILSAAASQLNIDYMDPQPQMEQASRSKQYYFTNDRGHANAEGNDIIAQWVLEFLEQRNLLGADDG